jgi:8-oxo-dGTP pyrophosphatase MutT (NUDIX family)
MNVGQVRQTLASYLHHFPEDRDRVAPVEAALDTGDEAALSSRLSPGHLTAGAILIDRTSGVVLQLKHAKLGRWLLPGGHVELSDQSLIEAARRELIEEAGSIGVGASLIADYPVDVDIHPIPPRSDGSEGEHLHFDFRFGFSTSTDQVDLAPDEVTDFRWIHLDDLGRLGERIKVFLSQTNDH